MAKKVRTKRGWVLQLGHPNRRAFAKVVVRSVEKGIVVLSFKSDGMPGKVVLRCSQEQFLQEFKTAPEAGWVKRFYPGEAIPKLFSKSAGRALSGKRRGIQSIYAFSLSSGRTLDGVTAIVSGWEAREKEDHPPVDPDGAKPDGKPDGKKRPRPWWKEQPGPMKR